MNRLMIAALCMFTAPLFAQEPETPKPEAPKPARPAERPMVERRALLEAANFLVAKDADGDGRLSKAEFGNDERFDALDKNKDTFLSLQELAARPVAPQRPGAEPAAPKPDRAAMAEEFKSLDRNDDGVLTKEEIGDTRQALFERGDKDKDGKLTIDEWVAARGAEADKPRPADRRPDGDAFATMDKDGDGKISREEAPERIRANLFDRADKDKDGFLTREEFEDMRKAAARPAERRPEEKRPERRPDRNPEKNPEKNPEQKPEQMPQE